MVIEHLGLRLRGNESSLWLSPETYVTTSRRLHQGWPHGSLSGDVSQPCWLGELCGSSYELDEGGWHRKVAPELYDELREQALVNLELNLRYFGGLDRAAFSGMIDGLQERFARLRTMTDLTVLDGVPGVYVLVMDGYCQAYVGQSGDMLRRIRQHWSYHRAINRLVWGDAETSVLPVDAFRALDSTRVLAWRTTRTDLYEQRVEAAVERQFSANRIEGGRGDLAVLAARADGPRRRALEP